MIYSSLITEQKNKIEYNWKIIIFSTRKHKKEACLTHHQVDVLEYG